MLHIPLNELYPFKNHPFHVREDESMAETVESIKENGVLVPGIAREREGGGYEIIAGHRRAHASQLARREDMPFVIRNVDDDTAILMLVDSNLQRENILPSERAFAYRMKNEALKRQGKRTDLTLTQFGTKLEINRTDEKIAQESGESRNQVQRYIRLTELIPDMLQMVDEKKMALNAAYDVSFLPEDEQRQVLYEMEREDCAPSLAQAKRLKQFSQEGRLTEAVIAAIMTEEKEAPAKMTFNGNRIKRFFPASYTSRQIEDEIVKLLEIRERKKQRNAER